jgi:hypothetical protein
MMWIPFLAHSEEYPVKVHALLMAVSILVTAGLMYVTAQLIEESKKLRSDALVLKHLLLIW